jgi:hypothetical protein
MHKRERRRDCTYRHARKAQRTHVALVHPRGDVDCPCERSPWGFAKRGVLLCNCRRRWAGRPKRGTGPCHGWYRRPVVDERIAWRRERFRWMRLPVESLHEAEHPGTQVRRRTFLRNSSG